MSFTTDNQTLEDLNIFGKRSGNSIYSLFNHTKTRGGAAQMENMFRFPLSSAAAIINRTEAIKVFNVVKKFPFDPELFDIVEQYLANTDERIKLSTAKAGLIKTLSDKVLDDPQYKFIYKGVLAIVEVLKHLHKFIDMLSTTAKSPYDAELKIIRSLLSDDSLARLIDDSTSGKLPLSKLADYDQILRFRQREMVKKILEHIYQIDVYIAVARTGAERGFIFPHALSADKCAIDIKGLYQPHVSNAVANDVYMDRNSNIVFLTGANMAGKSTFMKSLGVVMFLAHMGFPVPASKMNFTVLDGIYTTINLPDNLGMGASHFYAEVLRLKKIAKELSLGKKLFVTFDELFRGTNVKDAFQATIAVTEAFASRHTSMFLISTHIIEAGQVLKNSCNNISFKYLPTLMNQSLPVYTYQLKNGITADRHGMLIIENEGILDILSNKK